MRVLFITPYDNNYRYRSAFTRSLTYMPLTMPYLAALIPPEYGAECVAVDEGVRKPDYGKMGRFDLVAITAVTSSVLRGYELAARFRAEGSYVVMGGHHVTLLPEEAMTHADTVLTGPADRIFPEFLADLRNGCPKPRYDGSHCDVNAAHVIPRRELMDKSKYIGVPTVIANYGCTNRCEFCVINSFWGGKHTARRVEEVVDELKGLKSRRVLFLDPSPTSNPAYAKSLFRALIPLKLQWAGLCTTDILKDGELFDLMIESGCIGILMGFETFSEESLADVGKRNTVADYKAVVEKFHSRGVSVLGTFMLGLDGDTPETLARMPDYIEEIGVDIPRFAIMTPYPNTPIHKRLADEGRILTRDWSRYDSIHAVFAPRHMTAPELEAAMVEVAGQCYTLRRIWRRAVRNPYGGFLKLGINLGFRIYHKKVEKTLRKDRSKQK